MKRRYLLTFSLILLALVVAALILAGQATPADAPVANDGFPLLTGTNLMLERVTVPTDLPGEFKLLVVAYDSGQQRIVDKWLRPLEALNEDYPQLTGYYVPLLPQDTADAAAPIILGMSMAASSNEDRARTVVVFTDVAAFNNLVDVRGMEEVRLFLLDGQNSIRWMGEGAYAVDTLSALEAQLALLTES